MLYRPLGVFVPLALVSLAYGLIKMTIDLLHDPNISASALLALMSTLFIVLIGMVGDAIATRLGRLNANTIVGVKPKDVIEIDRETMDDDSIIYSLSR
jgi:hypothetical protein